jgi:hypothetical protein
MSSDETEGVSRMMPCLYVLYAVLYVGKLNPPEIRFRTDTPVILDDCHGLRCEARSIGNLAWNEKSPSAEARSMPAILPPDKIYPVTYEATGTKISPCEANSQRRTDELGPGSY